MLQLAPRGEIAVPMAELEDPYLLDVKTHTHFAYCATLSS
jgi:hypothetical protein